MRTYEQIAGSMVDGYTFSNASEYGCWAARWCYRCRWDSIVNPGEEHSGAVGCNIVAAAMLLTGKRPIEWTATDVTWTNINGTPGGSYEVIDTCTEFEERCDGDDGPPPEDPPPPDVECDGQQDIIDVYLDTAIDELRKAPEGVNA